MHILQNQEFSIRAKALPAVEILRSATTNAARLLGMEGKLGTIGEHAIADLLIINENPLDDVTVLDDIEKTCFGIVKEGRVVMSKLAGLEVDEVYQ
jgi:imidazolonepropionase-like amidohydrolase